MGLVPETASKKSKEAQGGRGFRHSPTRGSCWTCDIYAYSLEKIFVPTCTLTKPYSVAVVPAWFVVWESSEPESRKWVGKGLNVGCNLFFSSSSVVLFVTIRVIDNNAWATAKKLIRADCWADQGTGVAEFAYHLRHSHRFVAHLMGPLHRAPRGKNTPPALTIFFLTTFSFLDLDQGKEF